VSVSDTVTTLSVCLSVCLVTCHNSYSIYVLVHHLHYSLLTAMSTDAAKKLAAICSHLKVSDGI